MGFIKVKRIKDLREIKGKGDDGWEFEERRRLVRGVFLFFVGW